MTKNLWFHLQSYAFDREISNNGRYSFSKWSHKSSVKTLTDVVAFSNKQTINFLSPNFLALF